MTNEQIIQYIKDNYPTQTNVYFWSTFILPDGTFVVPENDEDDYADDMYEHANIIGGVADNCFDGNWMDAEEWLADNCVKCNASYPYIAYPIRPTNRQYWAAEEYMECISKSSGGEIDVADYGKNPHTFRMPVQILVGNKDEVYSLVDYTPEDITKKVKKAVSGGILEENLNHSVREFTRDSRVRDKDGSLILCSLLPNESLDRNEYGIYFKRGKDYYLNMTNPFFTNETDDIVTYLRKMGYEKELTRYKEMKRVQYDYQVNEIDFVKYLGFDGIITYDKELFIAFNKNQVIPVDYNPPKTYKTIVGDVVLKENNDNQINDKVSMSIDNDLKLVVSEQSDDTITYDILKDVVTVGYITILPKEQDLKAIEIYNDSEKGKGIGTKVLTYLIENDIIDSLDVDRENQGAQKLYIRLGFKPYQLIWGSVDGNGNDRYIMVHSNKLNNYYVYYQGDSYTTTYADEDCILIANMKNGKVYFDVSIEDTVWEDLNDLNIYYEDIEEMLYTMKEGRLY